MVMISDDCDGDDDEMLPSFKSSIFETLNACSCCITCSPQGIGSYHNWTILDLLQYLFICAHEVRVQNIRDIHVNMMGSKLNKNHIKPVSFCCHDVTTMSVATMSVATMSVAAKPGQQQSHLSCKNACR